MILENIINNYILQMYNIPFFKLKSHLKWELEYRNQLQFQFKNVIISFEMGAFKTMFDHKLAISSSMSL
jgi:hypothetical protein